MSAPLADPGLMARFRAAGAKIAWRPAPSDGRVRHGRGPATTARIAHLHDEEARIESTVGPDRAEITVDAGPVGALVLLLEIDQRGPPTSLRSRAAGELAGFPQGAIDAAWRRDAPTEPGGPTLADLVGLARYALA